MGRWFWSMCLWLLALGATSVGVSACTGTGGDGDMPTSGSFTAMTYNVHGLPPGITKDATYERLKAIGPLLKPFDIVGMQEVFDEEGYDALTAPKTHTAEVQFKKALSDRAVGPGLLAFTNFKIVAHKTQHFKKCHGHLDNASDCLASKGFHMFTVILAEGVEVDVYNSHFEAGKSKEDGEARAEHVGAVKQAMLSWSKDRAIVFLGDTNLQVLKRPSDKVYLDSWIKAVPLNDGCDAVNCDKKNRIDRIFFRSGKTIKLEAKSWEIPSGFVDEKGTDLSDHEPIVVKFSWQRVP